jgi:hypothetical protein
MQSDQELQSGCGSSLLVVWNLNRLAGIICAPPRLV